MVVVVVVVGKARYSGSDIHRGVADRWSSDVAGSGKLRLHGDRQRTRQLSVYGPTSGLEILLNFICAVLPVPPRFSYTRLLPCPCPTPAFVLILPERPTGLPLFHPLFLRRFSFFLPFFLFFFIFDTSSLLLRGQPRKRRRVFLHSPRRMG